MRLTDSNLLIYAYAQSSPFHQAAGRWLEAQLTSSSKFAVPWPSILAFIRICANPRATKPTLTISEAWLAVEVWLELPCVWIPEPGPRHAGILAGLLDVRGLNYNDVQDAHLAALAIEHGLVLCSSDNGFKRFPGLRFENPLQP